MNMKQAIKTREKQTAWKAVFSALFGSNSDVEEKTEFEEWKKEPEVIDIIENSERNAKKLEKMFDHPDRKTRGNGRKKNGTTQKEITKGTTEKGIANKEANKQIEREER